MAKETCFTRLYRVKIVHDIFFPFFMKPLEVLIASNFH